MLSAVACKVSIPQMSKPTSCVNKTFNFLAQLSATISIHLQQLVATTKPTTQALEGRPVGANRVMLMGN